MGAELPPPPESTALDAEAIALDALALPTASAARSAPSTPASRWFAPLMLLGAILASRLIALDQPIVENYVGRQIPTAMVARNLERGDSFLLPQLHTGPFPNYFLVEPPIYQTVVVALRRLTHLPLDAAGRATSALATCAAALGLYLLVSRMRDRAAGLWSLAIFGLLPVTLRYGRAFQPDMFALAGVLLGASCWNRWANGGRWYWIVAGWTLLSLGVACKVLYLFILLPVVLMPVARGPSGRSSRAAVGLLVCATVPVLAMTWYYHNARGPLDQGAHASRANLQHWYTAVTSLPWLQPETWLWIFRLGVVRAFTPIAVVVFMYCLFERLLNRFWVLWSIGAGLTLLVLAGKLHHEYYWLLLAPVIAAAFGTQLARLAEMAAVEGRRPIEARVLFVVQAVVSVALAWSTWTTPAEWANIRAAAAKIQSHVPRDQLLIAREAVLFYADRRGMRLETEPSAIARAIEDCGQTPPTQPATLTDLLFVYDQYTPHAHYLVEIGAESPGVLRGPVARFADANGWRAKIAEPDLLLIDRSVEIVETPPTIQDNLP